MATSTKDVKNVPTATSGSVIFPPLNKVNKMPDDRPTATSGNVIYPPPKQTTNTSNDKPTATSGNVIYPPPKQTTNTSNDKPTAISGNVIYPPPKQTTNTFNDKPTATSEIVIYPPPKQTTNTSNDRPTTAGSIQIQIIENQHILPTADVNVLLAVNKTSSATDDEQKWVEISYSDKTLKTDQTKSQRTVSEQSKSEKTIQNKNGCKQDEVDAILARKMSSMDFKNGGRTQSKMAIMSAVEEEPKWRDIGEFEVLRRTKCRRLYAKLGQNKDLALFYRFGKFYAMEAWCSHMGGPLFEGDIEEHKGACHVMCPWHAYMFELTTGRSDIGLKQEVYPVKCEDGHVFVEYICPLAMYPFL